MPDEQLIKRLKSFLWRTGMMGVAAALAFALDNINMLELSPLGTTLLGLFLGEVSKYVRENSKTI